MAPLVTALVLFLTVTLGMAIGVVSGYLIISSILNAFARKPASPSKPIPSLQPQGIAGD